MLHLATRMAARRLTALLAVAFAVLGGAGLLTATGVLAESGLRSHLPAGRLAGADVVVAAEQTVRPPEALSIALPERAPVPAEVADRLRAVPGVDEVVADVSLPAALVDDAGDVVVTADPRVAGHGWSSVVLAGAGDAGEGEGEGEDGTVDGEPPADGTEVALAADLARAAGVATGDTVRVVAAGETGDYTVSAVVDADVGILFSDATALELSGRTEGPRAGTVDLVGLVLAPGPARPGSTGPGSTEPGSTEPRSTESGADAVRGELAGSGLVVLTGDARGDAAEPGATASGSLLLVIAGSLAGITVLLVGFVVAGALAVSVAGQRRELALMRAVGATPRQVRRLVAAEATVVAGAALVPGIGLGHLMAGQLRQLLAQVGMLPLQLPLTTSPLPALATAVLVVAAVQVAARVAALRTSRLPATEAVAESVSEPRRPSRVRTAAGQLLVVAALTLSVAPLLLRTDLGAAATPTAGILAAIGLALAGPDLVRRLGDLLGRRLPPRASAPTWLAVADVRGRPLRLAGVVTALAMAVVFTLTYVLSLTTVTAAASDEARAGTLADASVTAPGLGGLPGGLVADVREVPGVEAAAPVTPTTVLLSRRVLGAEEVEALPALVLTPEAGDALDLAVREGSLDGLTGDTVALGAGVVDADVGSVVSLRLGDGRPVEATVVAVFERSLGFGPVVLSRDLAAGHTTADLDQELLVRTDGTRSARVALEAAVGEHAGVVLADAGPSGGGPSGGGPSAGGGGAAPPETWVNLATVLVLLGYLFLSVAHKLVAATSQRRHEVATLRLVGMTPTQVLSMMRRQAALVAAVSLGTGLALAAVPLAMLGIGFRGIPWAAGPWWLLPATALVVASLAFATIELPTRRTLRVPPATVLTHG
jgi:putative ABC transport system permease protein